MNLIHPSTWFGCIHFIWQAYVKSCNWRFSEREPGTTESATSNYSHWCRLSRGDSHLISMSSGSSESQLISGEQNFCNKDTSILRWCSLAKHQYKESWSGKDPVFGFDFIGFTLKVKMSEFGLHWIPRFLWNP